MFNLFYLRNLRNLRALFFIPKIPFILFIPYLFFWLMRTPTLLFLVGEDANPPTLFGWRGRQPSGFFICVICEICESHSFFICEICVICESYSFLSACVLYYIHPRYSLIHIYFVNNNFASFCCRVAFAFSSNYKSPGNKFQPQIAIESFSKICFQRDVDPALL